MTSLRPGPGEDTRTERVAGAVLACHQGSWRVGPSFTICTSVPCVQGHPASPHAHAGGSRVLRAAPCPQFLQLWFHALTHKINRHSFVLLLCLGLCSQSPETTHSLQVVCWGSHPSQRGPGAGSRVGAGQGVVKCAVKPVATAGTGLRPRRMLRGRTGRDMRLGKLAWPPPAPCLPPAEG